MRLDLIGLYKRCMPNVCVCVSHRIRFAHSSTSKSNCGSAISVGSCRKSNNNYGSSDSNIIWLSTLHTHTQRTQMFNRHKWGIWGCGSAQRMCYVLGEMPHSRAERIQRVTYTHYTHTHSNISFMSVWPTLYMCYANARTHVVVSWTRI